MDTISITNLFATQAAENHSAGASSSNNTVDDTFANIYDNLTASKPQTEQKNSYLDRSENKTQAAKQNSSSVYEQNKSVSDKNVNSNKQQTSNKQNTTEKIDNKNADTEKTSEKEINKTNSEEIKKSETTNTQEKTDHTKKEEVSKNTGKTEDKDKAEVSSDKKESVDSDSKQVVENTDNTNNVDKENVQNAASVQSETNVETSNTTQTVTVTETDDVIWNTLPENSDTKTVPVQSYTNTSDTASITNNSVNSSLIQSSTDSTSTTNTAANSASPINQDTAAKVETEQILSNVEFEKNVEDLTDEELKKLLNNNNSAQASSNTNTANTTNTQSTQTQVGQAVSSTEQPLVDDTTADIEIKTQDAEIQVDTEATDNKKQVETNVKSDTGQTSSNNGQNQNNSQNKITINLQSQNPGLDSQLQETEEVAVSDAGSASETTDMDTSADEALIKANAQNVEEQTSAINVDDVPNKVKDKAISTLQSAAPTATVESSKSSTDTSTDSNSAFSKSNANEEVIKMSVKNAAEPAPQSVDAFGAKIERNAFAKILNNAEMNSQLNKSDIMNQINSRFSELQNSGSSKITIVLRPENLGRIHLEIVNSHDGITAKMATENQQVKELLDKNMDALRASLSNQGVNVNNLKVETTSQSSNPNLGFEHEQFNQNASQHSHHGSRQTSNREAASQYNNEEQDYETDRQSTSEIQTSSEITHNGKVDYTV